MPNRQVLCPGCGHCPPWLTISCETFQSLLRRQKRAGFFGPRANDHVDLFSFKTRVVRSFFNLLIDAQLPLTLPLLIPTCPPIGTFVLRFLGHWEERFSTVVLGEGLAIPAHPRVLGSPDYRAVRPEASLRAG